MAEVYHLDLRGDDNRGYVEYSISPDYSKGIAPGETVTISGKALSNLFRIRSITYRIYYNGESASYFDAETNVNIARGAVGRFDLSFQIPEEVFASLPNRIGHPMFINSHPEFDLSSVPVGEWGDFSGVDDTRLTLLKCRLAPQILEMDFERATAEGQWADDGQYLQCKALKLAVNPLTGIDDITAAKITCAGSDGSSREVFLSRAQIEAALSSEGYAESKPGIFAGFASALGVNYTLTLTFGDAYDQTSLADTVMRSFARIHLSGAKNGGFAVGMFSSATDERPRFEVADNHESFFYGGIHGVTNYRQGEVATGGHWIDGKSIYRYVLTFETNQAGAWGIVVGKLPSPPGEVLSVVGTCFRHAAGELYALNFETFNNADGYAMCAAVRAITGEVIVGIGKNIVGIKTGIIAVEYTREMDSDIIQRPRLPMTADSSMGCVASSNATYTGAATYSPFKAFNDTLTPIGQCFVATTNAVNPYVQLQMDVALKNIQVEISSHSGSTDENPTAGTISGSNDGSSWTEIGSFSGYSDIDGAVLGTVKCNNASVAYRYVRVTITDYTKTGTKRLSIGNVRIFGNFDHYIEASADPVLPEGPEIFDDPPYADEGVARADQEGGPNGAD